jgi:beta-lactamase class A
MTFNDAPSPMQPGYRAELRELITLAISKSDNVATNVLFDILGREKATQVVQERYGLRETAFYRKVSGSDPLIDDPGWDGIHRNAHPASDAATLFAAIANDDVPYSDVLRNALGAQVWNDKLSKGLRPGDTFFHKTGDTSDADHDGGILLTAEGPSYIIVVYTGLESTDINSARLGEFMKSIRPQL